MVDLIKEFDKIYESERLVEMAIINPRFCKQHTLQAEIEQRDEGSIPHMHIYHNKSRNPKECSYIRLDRAEYANHHKDNKLLPKDIKKQFLELMNTPSNYYDLDSGGNLVQLNGYQLAVKIWVETFEDGNYSKFNLGENGLPIMPDYEKL